MSVYLIGMIISMVVYVVIGAVVSRNVKNADDFYVAGRRAPVLLIAGSMIASYTSTGMFMGDAAQCYDGVFAPIVLFAGMQSAGYLIGGVFFGRYLRRSNILTIPQFFGKRFCSKKMKLLAAITAIITMTVYLLSVIQGIGTLATAVTGVDYRICITVAMLVFTFITVFSGSRGVLITDTLMACLFTGTLVVSMLFISGNTGGWFESIKQIASDQSSQALLSWSGKSGVLYNSGFENVLWGLTYGVVWMSVCMVGPWQSSRYLMARNEHVVVRSSFISAVGVFLLEFLVGMAAVFVNLKNPDITDSSNVMIWAAMNLVPTLLGVLLLTGVLAAGISSATTFLSLIGASVANDIVPAKKTDEGKKDNSIRYGRIAMVVVSVIVLALAIANPPSIFWIMFLGGAIVSSSWMPVALASVFSKRLTKTGAFCGMLFGFLGCFVVRLVTSVMEISLPVYLDPSLIGIVLNVIAMIIGSACTKVTQEEKDARAAMFVTPETEKDPKEMRKTLKFTKWSVLIGVIVAAALLALWVVPYLANLG